MGITLGAVTKMAVELVLGIGLKLFIENGRVHWRDFVNDFLFWVPGVKQLGDDGLSRQAAEMVPEAPEDALTHALAAK